MTWVANSAVIVSAMTTLGYTRVEESLTVGETSGAKNHKHYTMTLGVPDTTYMTNNKQVQTDHVIIEIAYRQKTNADYDANYDMDFTLDISTILGVNIYMPSADSITREVRPFLRLRHPS